MTPTPRAMQANLVDMGLDHASKALPVLFTMCTKLGFKEAAMVADEVLGSIKTAIKERAHERSGAFAPHSPSAAAPQLLAALHECEAYLANREDVIDGDYGEPAPNKEMTLLIEVRAAIAKAEGQL